MPTVILAKTEMDFLYLDKAINDRTILEILNSRYSLLPVIEWCLQNTISMKCGHFHRAETAKEVVYLEAEMSPQEKTYWALTFGPNPES